MRRTDARRYMAAPCVRKYESRRRPKDHTSPARIQLQRDRANARWRGACEGGASGKAGRSRHWRGAPERDHLPGSRRALHQPRSPTGSSAPGRDGRRPRLWRDGRTGNIGPQMRPPCACPPTKPTLGAISRTGIFARSRHKSDHTPPARCPASSDDGHRALVYFERYLRTNHAAASIRRFVARRVS